MTYWGPGSVPPGYMLAPDGTLVPVAPGAQHPPYPPGAGAYGAYPGVPPGAVPYGYAPQQPVPVMVAPQVPQMVAVQPVMVTAHVVAIPTMPQPYGAYGAYGAQGAYLPPSVHNVPTMSPQSAGAPGAPTAYAPGWTNPHAMHGAGHNESSLAVAREGDGISSRERYQGEAGSVGALSLATSGLILATALATVTFFVVPVGAVLASAAVASGVTGGLGLWLLRQRKKLRGKVDLDPEIQVLLLDLATKKRGRLTVTSTAHGLGLTLAEAERALQAMAASHYVDVELDPDAGVVTYVFRELVPAPAQLPASTTEASSR